jgi:phospholipid transport system transporter-binding protein
MLQGELTLRSLPALIAARPVANGVVDLAAVSNGDSAGLAWLLELKRRAQRAGQSLQFINPPAQLRALAAFFKLESALFEPNVSR